jgi:toxin-antitoxin system PIN domain toxin
MRLLFDVNVWVALAISNHPNHETTRDWFDNFADGDIAYFCRITQQGLLRLICDPRIFPDLAVSNSGAWDVYSAFRRDPRVSWLDEPEGLDAAWILHARRPTSSPRIWMDAYLAAMAILHKIQFATFDRGFAKFAGLNWVEPGTLR